MIIGSTVVDITVISIPHRYFKKFIIIYVLNILAQNIVSKITF